MPSDVPQCCRKLFRALECLRMCRSAVVRCLGPRGVQCNECPMNYSSLFLSLFIELFGDVFHFGLEALLSCIFIQTKQRLLNKEDSDKRVNFKRVKVRLCLTLIPFVPNPRISIVLTQLFASPIGDSTAPLELVLPDTPPHSSSNSPQGCSDVSSSRSSDHRGSGTA